MGTGWEQVGWGPGGARADGRARAINPFGPGGGGARGRTDGRTQAQLTLWGRGAGAAWAQFGCVYACMR
eukprot:9804490-Lingulodinium_polyedra.AAC.1